MSTIPGILLGKAEPPRSDISRIVIGFRDVLGELLHSEEQLNIAHKSPCGIGFRARSVPFQGRFWPIMATIRPLGPDYSGLILCRK
jgi:hypothetical protein